MGRKRKRSRAKMMATWMLLVLLQLLCCGPYTKLGPCAPLLEVTPQLWSLKVKGPGVQTYFQEFLLSNEANKCTLSIFKITLENDDSNLFRLVKSCAMEPALRNCRDFPKLPLKIGPLEKKSGFFVKYQGTLEPNATAPPPASLKVFWGSGSDEYRRVRLLAGKWF